MASEASKAKVRDLRYGRRGGRWANDRSGKVDKSLAELHTIRMKALHHDRTLADGEQRTWPLESVDLWRGVAQDPAHPAHVRALEIVALVDA